MSSGARPAHSPADSRARGRVAQRPATRALAGAWASSSDRPPVGQTYAFTVTRCTKRRSTGRPSSWGRFTTREASAWSSQVPSVAELASGGPGAGGGLAQAAGAEGAPAAPRRALRAAPAGAEAETER